MLFITFTIVKTEQLNTYLHISSVSINLAYFLNQYVLVLNTLVTNITKLVRLVQEAIRSIISIVFTKTDVKPDTNFIYFYLEVFRSRLYQLQNSLVIRITRTIEHILIFKDRICTSKSVSLSTIIGMADLDYYPFGMAMGNRNGSVGNYRYGFNGKEMENEISGEEWQIYGMRFYSLRLLRFPNVDPLTKKYPQLTPYQFASNSPIANVDFDGLEARISIYEGVDSFNHYVSTFKREAETDAKMVFASRVEKVMTGDEFIHILKEKTKEEGSIGRVAIFSHGDYKRVYFTFTFDSEGKEDISFGIDKKNPASATIDQLVEAINDKSIIFAPGAVVIFGGCNTSADKFGDNTLSTNLSKEFTQRTGVTSIGATSQTTEKRLRVGDVYPVYVRSTEKYNGFFVKNELVNNTLQTTIIGTVLKAYEYKGSDLKLRRFEPRKPKLIDSDLYLSD